MAPELDFSFVWNQLVRYQMKVVAVKGSQTPTGWVCECVVEGCQARSLILTDQLVLDWARMHLRRHQIEAEQIEMSAAD